MAQEGSDNQKNIKEAGCCVKYTTKKTSQK